MLQTADGATRLGPGDYGADPGRRARTPGATSPATPARWADMLAPQPRSPVRRRHLRRWPGLPQRTPADAGRRPRPAHPAVRPHRRRRTWTPTSRARTMLAVSASMRTALLVYSGITVKMMVDTDLGARLTTMFMVQYDAGRRGRAARPPVRGDVPVPRGRGRGDLRRRAYRLGAGRRRLGRGRLRARLPQRSAAARCAGWRPRRRSRPAGTRTGSPATGTICGDRQTGQET